MDEKDVLVSLETRRKSDLLSYLKAAYRKMNASQRKSVFGDKNDEPKKARTPRKKASVDAGRLRREIGHFHSDSMAGVYYSPFDINSKNFMEVPEDTDDWCNRFARFVVGASKLTTEGKHEQAVTCFSMLFKLLQALDHGKEIIFAEEAGSWMIPADEKTWTKAYLKSLAATTTPEAFAAAVLPMVKRDGLQSFSAQVYPSAMKAANREQRAFLEAEVKRKGIRTESRSGV